jgi:membrane-associated phospholipid phosphatase
MILPYWANDWVVNLDLKLFGCHPTVWLEGIFTPWLTELMNFFYWVYFLFIPISSMTLYFRNRKKDAIDLMFLIFLSYYVNFLLFLLFPAEGAWIILRDLHTVEPEGGLFQSINQFMQANGSVRGGAFPSSHCSGAFIVAWSTFKYQRKLGILFLVLAVGVGMSTVYCRYHHAVYPIAGATLCTIMFLIGNLIITRWRAKHPNAVY